MWVRCAAHNCLRTERCRAVWDTGEGWYLGVTQAMMKAINADGKLIRNHRPYSSHTNITQVTRACSEGGAQ